MNAQSTLLIAAAATGALAVMAGAFGAHALKPLLSESGLTAWQTAVFYHMTHALLATAIGLASPELWRRRAMICLLAGCLLFSGSLYALALGGPHWLGPITPLGGIGFILGWLCLAVSAWANRHSEKVHDHSN